MERAKQLSVSLPNRPGMLAELCETLAAAKVSILAVSVVDSAEAGLIRLIVDNPNAARKALAEKGLSVCERSVRIVRLPNKVGALAEMARRFARRKLNILYVYGTVSSGRTESVLVVDAESRK